MSFTNNVLPSLNEIGPVLQMKINMWRDHNDNGEGITNNRQGINFDRKNTFKPSFNI